MMNRLANSMSDYMRTVDRNSTVAPGVVNGVQTCVRVVWPWLALPAALVFATCVLLIWTILKTANQANSNVWKSSPLAYLYHGLTETSRAEAKGGLITVDEMDRVAGRKEVLLTETTEGWRFVAGDRGEIRGRT